MVQLITRVKDAYIGKDAGNYTTWIGIRSVNNLEDTDPWIDKDIPYGKMKHQEIKSPHMEGELRCFDFAAMRTALYNTVIDDYNHKAIDATNSSTVGTKKWKVAYFVIHFTDQVGTLITATFEGFRVRKVELRNIEAGKEAEIIVKFCADEVVYT